MMDNADKLMTHRLKMNFTKKTKVINLLTTLLYSHSDSLRRVNDPELVQDTPRPSAQHKGDLFASEGQGIKTRDRE